MTVQRGWKRLGIVLSAIWLAAICGVATYAYLEARQPDDKILFFGEREISAHCYKVSERYFFFDRLKSHCFTFEQARGDEPIPDLLEFKNAKFVFLAAAPALFLFLLGYGIAWISTGFPRGNGDTKLPRTPP